MKCSRRDQVRCELGNGRIYNWGFLLPMRTGRPVSISSPSSSRIMTLSPPPQTPSRGGWQGSRARARSLSVSRSRSLSLSFSLSPSHPPPKRHAWFVGIGSGGCPRRWRCEARAFGSFVLPTPGACCCSRLLQLALGSIREGQLGQGRRPLAGGKAWGPWDRGGDGWSRIAEVSRPASLSGGGDASDGIPWMQWHPPTGWPGDAHECQ